jgi:hypothetical protein
MRPRCRISEAALAIENEAGAGIEPANSGFAARRLAHLAPQPLSKRESYSEIYASIPIFKIKGMM